MAQQPQQNSSTYQRAYEEWSERIGSAKTQLRNWRLACLCCLVIIVLLLIAIISLINGQKNYVYVAEVKPGSAVVNVHSLDRGYAPTQAQETYFIGRFINQVMDLPLDPVIVRNNWLHAYSFVHGRAKNQLNTYARSNPPFAQVGQETRTVKIKQFHPIGNHSYEFTWTTTTYEPNGRVKSTILYNGVFTVADGYHPKTAQAMLINPLGLRIVYFSFSKQEHS